MNPASETPHSRAAETMVVSPTAITRVRRQRRRWPWVLGGVIVLLLAVAVVVAESMARGYVADTIAARVAAEFELESADDVEVTLGSSPVIPQLIAGRLDSIDIEIEEFTLGELTGALELHAESVPLDEASTTELVTGRFTLEAGDLLAVAAQLSGLDPESITLDAPEIVVTATLELFDFEFSVGLGVQPHIADGALVFTPTSFRLGDEALTADELTSNPVFASLAQMFLQQEPICLAEMLPAAIVLDDVEVVSDQLVVTFTANDIAVGAPGERGTCDNGNE